MIAALGAFLIFLGLSLGLAWKHPQIHAQDRKLFRRVNLTDWPRWLDQIELFAYPLGTKWTLILVLGAILIWRFQPGWRIALTALLMAGFERGVKQFIQRPRPFLSEKQAVVRQNPQPSDFSFPSGDATRVWFLFSVLAFGLPTSWIFLCLMGLAAILVSIGRVRLGVHYPLDVWAGLMIGFGAGLMGSGAAGW
jgi:undecaprenyl-diphosphatase